ncbi:AT-hook motif nuclear-localized protein 9-like [Prosopis cineraria]|uniref:AT-hook motif nuclear-localized protein 9-like n=1 Tax=Prosopis cineraria TaxID=364024 RepID=UPI00240FB2DC|nr:AT-hook motif nuclear-localized protein 9-like [Prosopis cineraria]XP_054783800.1 AT-hook motif nuclear-localized protein 9-like [Prosopis cineraria]
MDRGDQMALSGSASYYMQRGIAGSAGQPELHGSPTIHQLSNSNLPFQPSIGGGTIGSTLPLESSAISPHGVNVGASSGVPSGEPVKRKRGRPRKYGPDGTVSLALTPLSSSHPGTGQSGSGTVTQSHKRGRGRPPGTGKKQQLASLGELMSGSAGMGFTPHIITIAAGEDIVSRIMAFSQQGSTAVCVLSANGAVSNATLRQPSTLGGSVTYEGRYEILCLSGSYLLNESGGSRNRTGGLSVSLASPEGKIIGGGVGGMLIAACPVQVIVGSFSWGGSKTKNKKKEVEEAPMELDRQDHHAVHNPVGMNNIMANQNLTPPSSVGTWPTSRTMDIRNSHVDIDLMRG